MLFFLLFSLLGTCILWIFKYHNQGLGFSDFRFTYPGNLLQLFLWILSIIGVTITFSMRNPSAGYTIGFYKNLALFGLLLLFLGKFISFISISSSMYFFEQPVKRVATGLCYFGYEGLLLLTIAASWTSIYGVSQLYYLRTLVNSGLLAIILMVFAFIFTSPWYGDVKHDKTNPYQYGVVLGAAVWSNSKPSPILVSRLDEAMNLYRAGIIKELYLTGSNAPGEISEAEAAFNYLKKYNIPLNDIQLEKQTTSTTEQIRFLRSDLLKRKGIERVLVISDKNHVRRIREISKFYNIDIDVVGAELNLSYGKNLPYRLRESAALLIFWLFGL